MYSTRQSRLLPVLWLVCGVALVVTRPSLACLWDYDTLRMERQRFPDVLELITGKFLRHSPEFYRWRIDDRLSRLTKEPDNLALYDDLAVAYEKTGQHEKAIETMLLKESRSPGLYETYANLGTFYVHSGQLPKGLSYIEKAIEINPDAHFGREIVQKYLVEYVLSRQEYGGLGLPLGASDGTPNHGGFNEFLAGRVADDKAVKGVLGMMRFGHFDSPVLLEALGDLLPRGRLRARAYLKASYAAQNENEKQAYRDLAAASFLGKRKFPIGDSDLELADVESELEDELKEAETWYAQIKEDEARWIREGRNVDEEFASKYYEQPRLSHRFVDSLMTYVTFGGILQGFGFVLFWTLVIGLAARIAWRLRGWVMRC